jgi:hypothetical protein
MAAVTTIRDGRLGQAVFIQRHRRPGESCVTATIREAAGSTGLLAVVTAVKTTR